MTNTAIQSTDLQYGSSRMQAHTDTPWWKVRASLALGLAGSLAAASAAYHFAGIVHPGWTLTAASVAPLLVPLSTTPALGAIGLAACILMGRRSDRRLLQILCGLLAITALAGAGLNVAREATGHGAIEFLIEKAILDQQDALAGPNR